MAWMRSPVRTRPGPPRSRSIRGDRPPVRGIASYLRFGGCHVTAGRFVGILRKHFDDFGIDLKESSNVISTDPTTLFICAGMQPFKERFRDRDGSQVGSLQSCIRTNDIDEVGDGSHLTYFQMVGSFGFGSENYEHHVEFWHSLMSVLGISVDEVRCHPDSGHRPLWERRGHTVVDDPNCEWSDGGVGGYCSEMFKGGLEIGNLVNPSGHSVDVGFGFERLYQLICGKSRVDETDLFRQDLGPVSRDHFRTLKVFREQGILPGNKGRNYVCRRLLRRFMRLSPGVRVEFSDWVEQEQIRLEKSLRDGRRYFRRNPKKPPEFWWDTFGILPEEIDFLGD